MEAKVRKIRVAKVKGDDGNKESGKGVGNLDDKEKAVRLEEKVKKLVLEYFHKLIKVFEKKVSEKMLMWDHMIDLKEGFIPRKVIPCL